MKPFELTRKMMTMRGQFYPTGHIVAMFPSADAAQAAVRTLADGGVQEDGMSLISPEEMLRDVVRTVGDSDTVLPSAGTEADTTRRFAQFASQGHYTLLIPSPEHGDAEERVMAALKRHGVAHAQKYSPAIIEDIA